MQIDGHTRRLTPRTRRDELPLPLDAARGALYSLALGSALWLVLISALALTRALVLS